ncbi:hypothetical protein D3C75_1258920 [compost metagenome]
MRLHSLDADVQLLADVLVGFAFGNKQQHFLLALGQTGGIPLYGTLADTPGQGLGDIAGHYRHAAECPLQRVD